MIAFVTRQIAERLARNAELLMPMLELIEKGGGKCGVGVCGDGEELPADTSSRRPLSAQSFAI